MTDLLIISFLVATLVYGYILSRRLEKLRNVLIELKPVLDAFSDAVDQSEKSVATMKEVSEDLVRRDSGLSSTLSRGGARAGVPASPERRKDTLIQNFWSRGKREQA